jgi:hypothetical protein
LTCQTLKTRKLAMLIQLASLPNEGGKRYAWKEAEKVAMETPELFAGLDQDLTAAMLEKRASLLLNAQALDSATAAGG